MKTVPLVEYTCASCKTKFAAPSSSDFCYGEFLLWSAPDSCAFLNAVEDGTYREVIDLIASERLSTTEGSLDVGVILNDIYGELACDADVSGNPYRMVNPPCPNCSNTLMDTISEKIAGETELHEVSHELWFSLSTQEKTERLRSALTRLSA